ncbi:MAG: ABC transporter permease [Chloroflexi bacterium]|nr:ABC transporter permease [Chloroflexota bacterium]
MTAYILRRLLLIFPTALVVVTLIFVIFRLVPGDPAQLIAGEMASRDVVESIRREMGLDKPIYIQYAYYLWGLLHGDLGISKVFRYGVLDQLLLRFPATIELTVAAMSIALLVGLSAGVVSAVKRGSVYDQVSMLGAIAGVCIPAFWLGLMLMMVLAVQINLLPATGRGTLAQLVLPAITLSAHQMAVLARLTRSSMLEVLGQDYIRTARSKGLRERVVLLRHALRNALIPTLTIAGLQFGYLLGGSIIVETVFAWPGIGLLMIDSVRMRDYTMVQGVVLLYAMVFLLLNLIIDIAYSYLDPRVRYD